MKSTTLRMTHSSNEQGYLNKDIFYFSLIRKQNMKACNSILKKLLINIEACTSIK